MKKIPSIQSRMVNRTLQKMVQIMFSDGLKLEKLRIDDFPEPGPLARKRSRIEPYHTDKAEGHWIYPRKGEFQKTILYCHGGAYVSGPALLHWRLLSHLAQGGPFRILMINYPKAPERPYPAALNAVDSATGSCSTTQLRRISLLWGTRRAEDWRWPLP